MLMLYPANSGTTAGSDLTIKNLKLICNSQEYPLTCPSNKQHTLSSEGSQFQCSISGSISSSTMCVLYGQPSIQSTGDTFNAQLKNSITSGESKFGDTKIGLNSVEGNKVIIKVYPSTTGTTASDDLFIYGLTIQNKELTCKAGEVITLTANTGSEIECSLTEEINGNILCQLGGTPSIFSTDDTFGRISLESNKVTSSFGQVKIELLSVKGTTVTIVLKPDYEGSANVDITGLKINDEKVLTCPQKSIDLIKTGTQFICTITTSMADDELCTLSQVNLNSQALNNLIIDEEHKQCLAGSSKFGKVDISLESILGTQIYILIKTKIDGITDSNKFTISGLILTSENKDYPMTCTLSQKLELKTVGTSFKCTITTVLSGGKEFTLKGVPTITSEGDTFSDIILSTDSAVSSFGDVKISLLSIVGNVAKIKLVSDYPGTTISTVESIDNLKWNEQPLTCNVGNNINLSTKPEISCTMTNTMEGNIKAKLLGNSPLIHMETNSKDVFGNIILDTNEITSSLGQLKVSLLSAVSDEVTIKLESEFVGKLTNLNINNLKLNNKNLKCQSGSQELELKKLDGTSNANIKCEFTDNDFSLETNILCTLTGNPSASIKLFTTQIITSDYQVNSGTRNFGDTTIYLSSIKGTTVYIQIKPSLSGKVRPIISNLKLKAGSDIYDVQCNIADKIQLYKSSKKQIKCYIPKSINTNIECNLQNNEITITSYSGDLFGNINISTDTVNVNVKPTSPTYGTTSIELIAIIGNEITIDITVSSGTSITGANPVVYDLYLGENKLYCVASQTLSFTNNKAQMKCTSSNPITCTSCQLSGTPTIVSLGDSEDTFGDTSVTQKTVEPTSSTLGNINIQLDEVIGTDVYINISSENNGQKTEKVDISNIYIDGQAVTCSDNIKFSTAPTRMKCSIKEPIQYDKPVQLTGTPSIQIDSEEESFGVVGITTGSEEIKSKSNSALNIKLINVKENYVIISIDAIDFTKKTLLKNFIINGLTINDIPLEINLDQIYLGGGPVEIKATLSESFDIQTLCELKGTSTATVTSEGKVFGPISNPTGNKVYSTFFKFGIGTLSLLEVHGYDVKLRITSTKSALTQNTVINDLYINKIGLTCGINDNIEFSSYGTDINCKVTSPINGNTLCTLTYNGEGDENFEEININSEYKTVYSTFQNFGNVLISLTAVNAKNVKIKVKTGQEGITTTNDVQIKNLFINNKPIKCQYDEKIEFIKEGIELDCTLDFIEVSETYTLTATELEIVSFADQFDTITIDEEHNTIRAAPKTIDETIIKLSSVAETKASIIFKTNTEIYTNMKLLNLKIKNVENSKEYSLNCPNKYINLNEKNSYTNNILCNITTTNLIPLGLYFTLVNSDEVTIESYDTFENIMIESNQVISTKFGDTIFNPYSFQFVLDVIPTNQETTLGPLIVDGLKLTSSSDFSLECQTEEKIELKSSGTKLYCTLKGSIGITKSNNEEIVIKSDYSEDSFGNKLIGQNFYDMQNTNCYALLDKTSCEMNSLCIYSKETYAFCDINYSTNDDISLNNNECILYSDEDGCNNNEHCFWNEEYKYTCKNKEIKNCEKLLSDDLSKCEKCITGYEPHSDATQCILVVEGYYPCIEYSSPNSCNSKSQCEYHWESFNYCGLNTNLELNTENNCHLYITREACNSQELCIWKTQLDSGCKEKYIENCIKLRESDPSTCEKCEEGYYLLGGISCTKKTVSENEQCEQLIDDMDNCVKLSFCEYSRRAFCYGGEGCYKYLTQELCEREEFCYWNSGNWNRCKVKGISNCLELSEKDATTCAKCKDGYTLINYNTTCLKTKDEYSEEDIYQCYYIGDEDRCNDTEICEYTKRERCQSYNDNAQCLIYLDKNLCEDDQGCYWVDDDEGICLVKKINNCLVLNNENIQKCKKCEIGFILAKEDTECVSAESGFINININLIVFALILLLL